MVDADWHDGTDEQGEEAIEYFTVSREAEGASEHRPCDTLGVRTHERTHAPWCKASGSVYRDDTAVLRPQFFIFG